MAAHQAPQSLGFSRQERWTGLPFPSAMHESGKWKWSHSVVSNSSRPHGLQPTRLLHPWDFPGKSTGVGCHRLLPPRHWGNTTLGWSSGRPKPLRKRSYRRYHLPIWQWYILIAGFRVLVMTEIMKQLKVSINIADLLYNIEMFKEKETGFSFLDELWVVLYVFWITP